jgi:hypothetical protein
MLYCGAIWGSLVMIVLSFLVCLLTMKFYDWSKTDWLGLEYLKQLREEGGEGNRFSRALAWALRRGNWAVVLVLSLYKDPFYATVYMRKGAHEYTGMGKSEWKVFLSSLVIANLYWSVLVNVGLSGLKLAWHYIAG